MIWLYSSRELDRDRFDPPPTWKRAETKLRDKFDLVEDHGPHHDAREQDGTLVELKSCVHEYADGRFGRFEIWESQITGLLLGGKVALLVYDREPPHRVVGMHLLGAAQLVPAGTHYRWQHPTMGKQGRRRIPWPEVMPIDSLQLYQRARFQHLYDDEAVENTTLPILPDYESEQDDP